MRLLPTFATVLATLLPAALHAADWQVYDRQIGKVLELDAQSVHAEGDKVFFRYRERWLNISVPGAERPIAAVVDCATLQRADVRFGGAYTLTDVYPGTGHAHQLDRACQLARSGGAETPVRPGPESVIRLVTPQPRIPDLARLPRSGPLKVAFVYVGTVGDGGWVFAHDRGRQAMEAQLGRRVQVTRVERVPEGDGALPVLQQLVDDGNELVFATSFGYGAPLLQVAQAHPGVRFEHEGGWRTAANVRTYEIRADEGAYLAGIVAGRMTRTGVIGVVASVPIPELVRNINAFTLGARSVNPRVRTRVAWVGEWFNPPKEAGAAEALIRVGGADVLLQNTDSSQVLATAQRLGRRAIGWNSDMQAYGPAAHLGSVVLNWGPYYSKAVRDVLDGSWATERVRWGVRQDAVELASLANDVPQDARARVAAAVAGMKDGSFSVWQGPIADTNGRLMVEAGSFIDDAHLETMYFYVDGVDGKLPAH